ncbi:MAG: YeeE/YedE family protein [Acidobacteriota bacterium]|nr:YeeE/YedE family protein [Acidobacteriota bacterium]
MIASEKDFDRRPRWFLFWLNVLAALGFLLAAVMTRQWIWTAVPVGQLFGFFLAKGDLCGASAFSEVLLMRDGRKSFGLWTAIVTAMSLFAAAQAVGWVTLAPKPLLWASYILGGLIFGTGTVLAGGCISGCLYKAAGGNLNSIVALLTIPAGIAFVEHGPLTKISGALKSVKSVSSSGGPVTLPSLTGMPFWAWAAILSAGTVLLAILFRRRTASSPSGGSGSGTKSSLLTRPWKPWQAGLAIGVMVALSLISSAASGRNYPIGITHGVLNIQELVTDNQFVHVFGPPVAASQPASPTPSKVAAGAKKITWWLVLVTGGLFSGALAAASLSGRIRLSPKPPSQVVTAAGGGFLVGVGAGLATGCVVGNVFSGWALLSVGMFLFGIAMILANWITTYFYLMNGTLADMPGTFRLIFKRRR